MTLGTLGAVVLAVAASAKAAERPEWTSRSPEPAGGWVYFVGRAVDQPSAVACREEALRDSAVEASLYIRHETRASFAAVRTALKGHVREELRQASVSRLEGARAVEWHEERRARWSFLLRRVEFRCWVLIVYPEAFAARERGRLDSENPSGALSGVSLPEENAVEDEGSTREEAKEMKVSSLRLPSASMWHLSLVGGSFGSGYSNMRILEGSFYFKRPRIGIGGALFSRTSGDFRMDVRQSARTGGRFLGEERFSFDSAFPLQVSWAPIVRPYGGGRGCCAAVVQLYASYTGWASPLGHLISEAGEAGVPKATLLETGVMIHAGAIAGLRAGVISSKIPEFEHRNFKYAGMSGHSLFFAVDLSIGGFVNSLSVR